MIDIKVNTDAIELNAKNIEQLMTDNPDFRKRLQDIIRTDIWEARNAVVRNISGVFDNGDPAESRRAIRNIVYEKILGANLNMMNMKRGTAKWSVRQVERKVEQNPHMRGGNRRKRSYKTIRMHGYEGKARGMILRWVDEGNQEERKTRYGNRGMITPRNFFRPTAQAALNVVAEHIGKMIDDELQRMYDKNNK
jgi:hypothetical protein